MGFFLLESGHDPLKLLDQSHRLRIYTVEFVRLRVES